MKIIRLYSLRDGLAVDVSVGGRDEQGGCYPSAMTPHNGEVFYLGCGWFDSEEAMWAGVGMWAEAEGFKLSRPIGFKGAA